MQKSIKKIIAGAVAGLMVISSMPFTALAAVGDYEPDVQLQFSTFYDADKSVWGDYSGTSATCYSSAGLSNIPLEYDATAGTLVGRKADMDAYNEYWEEDPVEGDWELAEGDIFAVTVRMDNIQSASHAIVNIRFSDNLEPAGLWQKGTGKKATFGFCAESEIPSGASGIVGFKEPVADWSASELYDGMNDSVLGDLSSIKEDPHDDADDEFSNLMMSAQLLGTGNTVDMSSVDPELGFFDIENHTISDDGYTYENKAIMATFVFAITDDTKPIKFALQDPYNEFSDVFDGAYVTVDKSEGNTAADRTTYAVNKYNTATMKNDGDTEWPGSTKMTFMGTNVNRQSTHTHTPGTAVKENEVAATCTTAGSYDSVVYCTECGEEISRTKVTVDALNHDYTAVVTEPTCTEQGYTTYTCKRGDDEYVADYTDPLDHLYAISSIDWDTLDKATGEVTAAYVCERDASHTKTETVQTTFEVTQQATEEQPELTTYMYSAGEFHSETTVETAPALEHTHVPAAAVRENEVPASCSAEGSYDEVVYCSKCGEEISREKKTIDKIAHTPGTAVRENEVPASCSAEGSYDEVVYCTECNEELSREKKTIDKIAHTPGEAVRENEVPASCSAEGSYDEVVYCTECNEELSREKKTIDKIAHTPGEAVRENEVAPTKETAGSYDEVVYCTECNEEISRTTKSVDALGVTITLAKSDIGYVEGLETGANKLAFGATYTVTATPVDGAKFVGWEIGGNIVSKEATYTGKAASDITLTPVFEDAASDKITVTFFDKYGNTVKQYKDMTAAQYQEAIAADIDTLVGPNYPSYTFAGWEKTKDEILAIDSSATVWGTYEKVKEEDAKKYTVTTSAELILPDGVENKQIPYDTKVTVRDTAAKAWRVGEAIVAYGPEYTFYVGSDVTVEAIYETVEEKATTTVVGANLVAGSDYKFNIVATRNIPDGYELDDYGFVYGKNLTDEELNLDKVGETAASGAQIKAVHGGTRNLETNEFAFNYGIKAKNAPVTAKSFVIVSKDGKTEIIYSDMFTQNY